MSAIAIAGPSALSPAVRSIAARERATRWWTAIVTLSAFGPYIGGGLLEQAAIFSSAGWVLVTGWPRILAARRSPSPWPLILLAAIESVILIGTFARPFDPGFLGSQPASHGVAYFLLPAALIIVTWYWTLTVPASDLIVLMARLLIGGMAVNGVIAVAQLASGNVVVLGFLPRFWSASQAGSVAVNAAENFRYTGIFDQPAQAGLAYGLALLCVIFLVQRGSRRPVLLAVCAAAVITGGVLALSKVFLLGALPVAVLTVLRGRYRVRVFLAATFAAAGFWLLGRAGVLPSWQAAASLEHLADPAVTHLTGARYGTGGTLGPGVADVMHASPWYGFGGGGLGIPYDSLWLEALVLAGIAGVILVAALLGVLAWRWAALHGTLTRPEWLLAGASLALAAGGSLGIPSLTTDRAMTLLWLILGLLVCARQPGGIAQPSSRKGARTAACGT